MAHTKRDLINHTSNAAANPTTFSATTLQGDTVLVLMLVVGGGTNRAGGSPSINGQVFQQANSTQKAAASPEASAELWYLLNPHTLFIPGTYTVTVPNTGALTIFYALAAGIAKSGSKSALDVTGGTNGTSANPAPGSVTPNDDGDVGFSVVATGAQTWSPSAQAGTGCCGTGTSLGNFDDGATGSGFQSHLQATKAAIDLGWTFATSDDWGAVVAYFKEIAPHALNNYMAFKGESGLSIRGIG